MRSIFEYLKQYLRILVRGTQHLIPSQRHGPYRMCLCMLFPDFALHKLAKTLLYQRTYVKKYEHFRTTSFYAGSVASTRTGLLHRASCFYFYMYVYAFIKVCIAPRLFNYFKIYLWQKCTFDKRYFIYFHNSKNSFIPLDME